MGMLIDVEIAPPGWDGPPPVWFDDGWVDPSAEPFLGPDEPCGPVDPIDRVVGHLATVDRAMASGPAPAQHCDVHHVIPRQDGGPTEVANLMLACRLDHTRLTRHRWQLTLHPDATLTVRIGRHTYTTRPRLPAPPTVTDGRQPGRPDQPVTP